MASLEALILRHYFELQGFLVRQCLPNTTNAAESLHIVNPSVKKGEMPSPILFSSDLAKLPKALVWIPGWNALKITPALLKNAPELTRFIDKHLAARQIPEELEEGNYAKIVLVPSVPTAEPYRTEIIQILKARGIDSMLSLRSVLLDLIARLDVRQPREGLQLLQILSNFDLLKTMQLDLFNDDRRR